MVVLYRHYISPTLAPGAVLGSGGVAVIWLFGMHRMVFDGMGLRGSLSQEPGTLEV